MTDLPSVHGATAKDGTANDYPAHRPHGALRPVTTLTTMADLFVVLLVCHLVVDFLLQPTWMAMNKHKLNHPASWLHSLSHAIILSPFLSWGPLAVVFVSHLLIDTYIPVSIWLKYMRPDLADFERKDGLMWHPRQSLTWPAVIWADQTMHISFLVLAAILAT